MTSLRYLNDLPDPVKETAKCREFLTNFSDDGVDRKYFNQLQEISNRERRILTIELDDVVMMFNEQEFANNIQRNTPRYIRYFEEEADKIMPPPSTALGTLDVLDVLENQRIDALQRAAPPGAAPVTSDMPKSLLRRYEIAFIPLLSTKPRKLREIRADDIGHLVSVRGLVTRSSDVKPCVSVCTYTCEVCGSELFQDVLGSSFMPLQKCPSQRCQDNKTNGKLTLQTRGSRFLKYQELRLQELPDQVPTGHIPRSMTVHCRGEVTRQCGPGDIITVSGVFLTVKYSGYRAITAGLQADTFLEAFRIEKQKLNFGALLKLSESESVVREIARDANPYERLANSIAPEIFGHEDVKKALLLQLVGGASRNLSDGMKIRGDINICLMGDPGVAKSQLLKYIATIAPRGIYTTGKGSSGVGLTAAVVRDPLTGDLTLEGGALVLADMGICCIDEFDKMDEHDRTAIHEVMEQQTVSIAKAGITTTLNARASVLAAANPLYGRYNIKKSISENVDLPNSLLSRFDLLFLILDKSNMEKDIALSKHVLHVHKHLENPNKVDTPVSIEAFKQYIGAARTFRPKIPKELTNYIVEAYVALRAADHMPTNHGRRNHSSSDMNQAIMTARQLLSILRLSQALARLRLSDVVANEDVDEAIRLTHASKSSLAEESNSYSRSNEDVFSQIFNTIRDLSVQTNNPVLSYAQVETMILKKGFTADQLRNCLNEYSHIGVFAVDTISGTITLET